MNRFLFLFSALCAVCVRTGAQQPASAYVDASGVLRWTGSDKEIAQFGVNYTAPFAFSYRAHERLGIPITTAIDADVYHMARMGLDAFRVHVWDRQITDSQGNLLVNEHLKAFDYLVKKLKERGIKIILTPLLFGDAGYPETHVPFGASGEGFSSKYGKQGCLENKESWPLQERYLTQFVDHVNPGTGLALKDDPDVIGFEICNEPGHFDYAPTLEYINRMTKAIRDTGCLKPIFYNMSHGMPVAQAYLDSDVQGGTFQWYPSSLVAGHEQLGNFLPYVEDYPIPFADNPKFKTKAKIVYEFDSADIGRSYIYPAMARSFRAAGMQFATQFAYDPMYLAPYNTEYQTHFLNLAYAPQKALSMKIAAEAFRRIPRFKTYGEYPRDTSFEGVHVSYAEDLAVLSTPEDFFYTNNTSAAPPSPKDLRHVAGYGVSPVVSYPGRGAYFLDQLSPGTWRLEVMPDSIWVADPFEKASPKKQVARIAWNEWPMRIDLPDLGENFTATGLNAGNSFSGSAAGDTLAVRPGAYLLTRVGVVSSQKGEDKWENITLGEFVAPVLSIDRSYVILKAGTEATEGRDLSITATVASNDPVQKVTLVAYLPRAPETRTPRTPASLRLQPGGGFVPGPGAPGSGGPQTIEMRRTGGFEFTAEIPGAQLLPGTLRYFIVVQGSRGPTTFPSEFSGTPTDWDFYGKPWEARIVRAGSPVVLFETSRDAQAVTNQSRERRYNIVPSDQPGSSAIEIMARDLDLGEHDESFRFFFRDKVGTRKDDLGGAQRIVMYGRSATDKPCTVQLALITQDGIAYGATVSVTSAYGRYTVPIQALEKVPSPNIPHGYPVFLRYWSTIKAGIPLDVTRAESVLVSIGPGIAASDYIDAHGVQIERIWLE
jgi:hypothetical protein